MPAISKQKTHDFLGNTANPVRPSDAVDLLVDSGGWGGIMLLALTDRGTKLLNTTPGATKAFGAHFADIEVADLILRQAVKDGLNVRMDGNALHAWE
jgi:hypothetical protein